MTKSLFEKFGDIAATGIPVLVAGLLFFQVSHLEAAKFGYAYLIATILIHLIKATTYAPRPRQHEGEWVRFKFSINSGDSFPSGHTGSAMTGACYAAWTLNPYIALALGFLAALTALSRVHAKAHFYRDVFWGMLIAQLTVGLVQHNLFDCAGWLIRLF